MGCRPTGNSLSCVGPAIGRLMLAKRPPLALFQVQTLGGVYSVESDIGDAPVLGQTRGHNLPQTYITSAPTANAPVSLPTAASLGHHHPAHGTGCATHVEQQGPDIGHADAGALPPEVHQQAAMAQPLPFPLRPRG